MVASKARRSAVSRAIGGGLLKPLLTDWQTTSVPLSVVYPQTRHLSAKVRVFVDFVAGMFPLPKLGFVAPAADGAKASRSIAGKAVAKAKGRPAHA